MRPKRKDGEHAPAFVIFFRRVKPLREAIPRRTDKPGRAKSVEFAATIAVR